MVGLLLYLLSQSGYFAIRNKKDQLSKLSEIKERTSSLQPPSFIVINTITNLPFPVLVMAST